jgi:hypothetical protein
MSLEVKHAFIPPGRAFVAIPAFSVALALLLASCGGATHSKIQLSLTTTHYVFANGKKPRKVTGRYTLGCEPVSGTLPLAGQICADIAAHRQAMLAPRPSRWVCAGSPFMPTVDVSVRRGGSGGFSGSPGCGWPGGTPIAIYYAASTKDRASLAREEPLLRCEDDPTLAVQPTPLASAVACTRGLLWTPAAEREIRRAETVPQLTGFDPSKLFSADPGVRRCLIQAGGPPLGRILLGLCGVSLTGPPSRKTLHFVESWTLAGHLFRHHWIVRGRRVVTQSGPAIPQLWR